MRVWRTRVASRVFKANKQEAMAEFSVMINLGKADLDDYSLLAKLLRKTGFSETKAAQVAADYRLLPASFKYSSETENMAAVKAAGAELGAHKVSVVRERLGAGACQPS